MEECYLWSNAAVVVYPCLWTNLENMYAHLRLHLQLARNVTAAGVETATTNEIMTNGICLDKHLKDVHDLRLPNQELLPHKPNHDGLLAGRRVDITTDTATPLPMHTTTIPLPVHLLPIHGIIPRRPYHLLNLFMAPQVWQG